jgi:hypothetical protein
MTDFIDFSLFDWEEIFGAVKATEGMKRPQTRGLRSEIQELATEKYSNGQFKYVGCQEDGKDYIDIFGNFWEDKAQEGMFQKKKTKTKEFILKNFQGNKTDYIKTFDFILLKDTKYMSVGWSTWEAVFKNIKIKDAVVISHVDYSDLHMIEFFVNPKEKVNISETLTNMIKEII